MKLEEILKKFGKSDLMSEKSFRTSYRGYSKLWYEWYQGKVRKFHRYFVNNGEKRVYRDRLSLGMAKTICEEWANLLLNEKTDIVISDKKTQEEVESVFARNYFWDIGNEGVEKSFALGNGAFVVSVDNMEYDVENKTLNTGNAYVSIEFVSADKMYPLTIENKRITECAFVSCKNGSAYISVHLIGEDGRYKIHNIVGKISNEGDIAFDMEDESQYYVFDTQSDIPWFTCLKPNICNNIDINSPIGVSVFANAIDVLKSVDYVYDSFASEFELGRKRLYISAEALKVDASTGETKYVFDPNDVLFYQLPAQIGGSDKPYIYESNGSLRVNDHVKAIQNQLNVLSTKVGFGDNHYRFGAGGVSTATQVISENSEMFRNVKKHEITIRKCIVDVVKAVIYASNKFLGKGLNESAEIDVKFDDSIIEDKNSEMVRDLQLVSAGIMAKWEYRVKYFNEDEETAKAFIENEQAKEPKIEDMFLGNA